VPFFLGEEIMLPLYVKTAEDYQLLASRTMKEKDIDRAGCNCALGIAGEAGEVVDYLKKVYFHGETLKKEKLEEELGDLLWYIANISRIYELKLTQIMQKNIDKLRVRYPDEEGKDNF
jgi:NTP pyrophosphatase (non-canonical NTP hydrolase)